MEKKKVARKEMGKGRIVRKEDFFVTRDKEKPQERVRGKR